MNDLKQDLAEVEKWACCQAPAEALRLKHERQNWVGQVEGLQAELNKAQALAATLRADLDIMRRALVGIIGSDDPIQLATMDPIIRAPSACEEEKASALYAHGTQRAAKRSAKSNAHGTQRAAQRLHPKYLTHDMAHKVMNYLPEEQESILMDHPQDILASDGTTLRVIPSEMTSTQQRQLLAPDHIRSESEQKAWLESYQQKSSARLIEPNTTFNPKKGLCVNGQLIATPAELMRMCARITEGR